MELLTSLGVDETIAYQVVIFLVTYVAMTHILFKPYFVAYKERLDRTEGNQEASERFLVEAGELKEEYELEAQKANAEFKAIYDASRTKAMTEYDSITSEAREKAKKMIAESRLHIKAEMEKARTEIERSIPEVTQSIVQKLIG